MSVPFYMDEHIHGAITSGLRRRGVDVLTAQEDGQTGVDDDLLLDRASALGRVLVSNDQDFLVIAARRQRSGMSFAGVVYAHQDNALIGRYVSDLETISSASEQAEYQNCLFIIPF